MDKRIREAMEREANAVQVSNVPWEQIRARAEEAAAAMPFLRNKRVGYAAAAVLAAGAVFSSGFVSPAMAEMLSKVPLVGSLFQQEGVSDSGLRTASLAGLETPVRQSITDQGVKLTYTHVIADENRTSVSFQVEFPEGVDGSGGPADISYEMPDRGVVNVRDISNYHDLFNWKKEQGNTYVGTFNVYTDLQTEDYTLKLHIGKLGTVAGNWNAEIPVSLQKALARTTVFDLNLTEMYKDTPITLEQIRVAPTATSLKFRMKGKVVEDLITSHTGKIANHVFPSAEVTDDRGNKIEMVAYDDGMSWWAGQMNNIAKDEIEFSNKINPLATQPKYLDIKLKVSGPPHIKENGNYIFEQRVELDWKSAK